MPDEAPNGARYAVPAGRHAKRAAGRFRARVRPVRRPGRGGSGRGTPAMVGGQGGGAWVDVLAAGVRGVGEEGLGKAFFFEACLAQLQVYACGVLRRILAPIPHLHVSHRRMRLAVWLAADRIHVAEAEAPVPGSPIGQQQGVTRRRAAAPARRAARRRDAPHGRAGAPRQGGGGLRPPASAATRPPAPAGWNPGRAAAGGDAASSRCPGGWGRGGRPGSAGAPCPPRRSWRRPCAGRSPPWNAPPPTAPAGLLIASSFHSILRLLTGPATR